MIRATDNMMATSWQMFPLPMSRAEQADKWCVDFDGHGRFASFTNLGLGLFYFEREIDRVAFVLVWGEYSDGSYL